MSYKYIYIDESGDLGYNKGSKYLIVSALITDNPKKLDKIIKNMRRNRFKRELKSFQELKANSLKKEVIIYTLEQLNKLSNLQVIHMVLHKNKLPYNFLNGDKNKIYDYVAGKLAKQIILDKVDLEIRIDKSKGKQVLRDEFNDYFEKCLRDGSILYKVSIVHSNSHNFSGLQMVDLLAWAIFQKYEHGNDEFINKVKISQEAYLVF